MSHYYRAAVAMLGVTLLSVFLGACGSPSREPNPEAKAVPRLEVVPSPGPEPEAARPSAETKQAPRDALDQLKSQKAAPAVSPPSAGFALLAPALAVGAPAPVAAAPGTTLELLPDGLTRLVNEEVGYSFVYPSRWSEREEIAPTPLANDSSGQCDGVGGGAGVVPRGIPIELYSFVQVCFRPLLNGLAFDEFIQQSYGGIDNAEIVDVNGTTAYRFEDPLDGHFSHLLQILQTEEYRLEILAESSFGWSNAEPILDSFQLLETTVNTEAPQIAGTAIALPQAPPGDCCPWPTPGPQITTPTPGPPTPSPTPLRVSAAPPPDIQAEVDKAFSNFTAAEVQAMMESAIASLVSQGPFMGVSDSDIQATVLAALAAAFGDAFTAAELQELMESAVSSGDAKDLGPSDVEAAVDAATDDADTAAEIQSSIEMEVSGAVPEEVLPADVQAGVDAAIGDTLTAEELRSLIDSEGASAVMCAVEFAMGRETLACASDAIEISTSTAP